MYGTFYWQAVVFTIFTIIFFFLKKTFTISIVYCIFILTPSGKKLYWELRAVKLRTLVDSALVVFITVFDRVTFSSLSKRRWNTNHAFSLLAIRHSESIFFSCKAIKHICSGEERAHGHLPFDVSIRRGRALFSMFYS